ncbi:hypothetical protein DUI87_24987 [Hirundo rustica rustica]|uniref:Chorein N-terminal domain-containing protein n=1 Tax=Hirundo rustica rustica TaxID=333673 RepID=A0A3M0JD41_HIRRU|nr:hypothetical protein DUI87_24987 [Hirundo rustica rustica]
MPWPFSESIKKRACRYLLQRYLGHFLQEKLSLEQLSLDLYQGTGSLTQVPLDKWCLNEILESADAPLEVTDGFIQSISLSVPWGSLLQDNCALEVKGLEMVFRPRPRLASGSEPMYWSSFMTSSMQLAKECLSQKLTDEQGEGSQPFEGLEKFAETIETVLRRVKVTFLDTVLRIEHVPENSKSGTALEIRVERTMYCDETADECSGINVHQPTAFAHKLLQLSGVSFFWDEFPASAKSSPVCSATQLATEPKLSPSWNPKIIYEPHPQLTRNLPEITPSDPVQICKLIGRMELSLTLKQNEVLPGAKLQPTWGDFLDRNKQELQPPRGSSLTANMVHQTSLRRTSIPSRSVSVDESRPELLFRLAVGTFSVSVLHIDPLPPPESSLNLNPLTPMARDFFARIEKIEPVKFSTEDFLSFREVFAEACSHDHLRFIGTGIKVSYEQRQRTASRSFSTDLSIGDMEFLECLFSTDSHSMQPHYTELLTFHSEERNDSHSMPCLQLHYKHLDNRGPQGSQGRLSSVPQKAELQIKLSPVFCELDISIVDRLNSLLQPQKLTTVEMMASHMYASYNKHISLSRVSVQVTAPALNLSVRFPIPDLRSDQERGPWFKKSLQKEILHLEFTDMEFKTEFLGGSTPEQVKLELTFKELTGSFEEDNAEAPVKFFQVSGGTDGDITSSSDNFDWPRIVLKINPLAMHSILERIAAEEEEGDNNFQEEEEGGSHSLKDVCDIRRPEPSPFSSRRVMFENEEQDDGSTLEGKYGEFWFEFNSGSLFSVTKYEGFEDRHYVCVHCSSLNLYHQGLVDGVVPSSEVRLPSTIRPHWLEPTICFSEEDGLSRTTSDGVGVDSPSMLTVAVKIQSDKIESNTKILYFLNISDEPVLGYNPPATITTFHVHLWSCALDYRPLYLPVRSLLTVETFSISSSVAVDKSSSTLRIILDEAALHLSDKCNTVIVNLHRDYVRVMDMGLLELTITTVKSDSEGERAKPRFELHCSSDVIHIRTCSDSCAALMNLIQYIASYGDLHPPAKTEVKRGVSKPKMKVETFSQPSSHGPGLAESEQQILRDLMSDAMEEIETQQTASAMKQESNGVLDDKSQTQEPSCSDLFLFPDESGNVSQEPSPTYASFTHHLISEAMGDVPAESDDFCILFAPKVAVAVKFQHEVYPPGGADGDSCLLEQPVSRQVFIVQDLEIRDRLATSQMNKFLYLYCSKEMPRKAHSNMLTVKALHVRPESGRSPQECCLRVSLMPLRLNIDQDALFFLKDFFTSLSTEVELLVTPDPEVKKSPGAEVTCSLPRHVSSLKEPSPVISFASHKQANENGSIDSMDVVNGDDDNFSQETTSYSDQPVFFREFRFTSEVPIRLDYHGKHVSMDQGTLAGILIGLAQLNCSELKLKRLCYRHGLLGVDKLFSYAISEWLNDIKKNQLPGILGGVGPMHSLVQLVQGLKDLVWLPIEQYRKDGRIVRGFQRGAASFGTSTAMAALELTNRMVQTIQAAAETAYDMVSPGPTFIEAKKIKRFPRHRLAHQPVDLREGVAKAYSVVKEGITDTAQTIYETAAREHENRGVTGAVGGVLRQIPPTVVKPFIVATEATSNVLGGMRNQIRPDVRQEESQKWRLGED